MALKRFTGKIAFVTGGASGIGAASVLRIAQEGAKAIAIADLPGQKDLAAALIFETGKLGTKAIFLPLDVSSEVQWIDAVAKTEKEFSAPLDVLVQSAGISRFYPKLEELEFEVYKKMIATNLDGVFLGIKHGIRSMMKNDSPDTKSIVNISSVEGIVGNPFQAHYSASKGGVRLMTKSAALYCAQADFPGGKIRVNTVHPGGVATPLAQTVVQHMANDGVNFKPGNAYSIGEFTTPDQQASAIAFLASNDASFVTGTELIVDGGWTAQ